MSELALLDNPIWHALNSRQRSLSLGNGLAARYPADVSRFAGLAVPTPDAFSDLAALLQPGESIALATAEPLDIPSAWQVVRTRPLEQMVCERLEADAAAMIVALGPADVPDMLALAAATEPGPFSAGTIGMGRYLGIRSSGDGRLVAMAGERMRLDGCTEISAVCTDPAFRGRGYARALVIAVATGALAEGCTPFLHVKTENGAKWLYAALGFRLRRFLQLTVLKLR